LYFLACFNETEIDEADEGSDFDSDEDGDFDDDDVLLVISAIFLKQF
jgi:hypothetical protein